MIPSGSSRRSARENSVPYRLLQAMLLRGMTHTPADKGLRSAAPSWGLTARAERLYRYAVLLALVPLALLLLTPKFTPFGLVGVVLLFLLRWVAYKSPFPHTRANPIVLIFALCI